MILFASSLSRTSYGTKALPKPVLARVDFGDATRGDVFNRLTTVASELRPLGTVLTPSNVSGKNVQKDVGEHHIVANGTSGGQIFSLYHSTEEVTPAESSPSGVLRVPVNTSASNFGLETIQTALRNAGLLK